ncbi:SHSA6 protein, partial [Polypterus senegalus]
MQQLAVILHNGFWILKSLDVAAVRRAPRQRGGASEMAARSATRSGEPHPLVLVTDLSTRGYAQLWSVSSTRRRWEESGFGAAGMYDGIKVERLSERESGSRDEDASDEGEEEKPRMNSILTSATEPYDLSFSRSFQSLSHLPPSYESAVKSDLSKYSSLKRLSDKEVDDYYTRKRHLPDLAARGTLPLHILKMSQEQQGNHRERPRRVQRAMSQDRVLSPERAPPQEYGTPYGGRILSDEQLLSAERLHSQDPLLSPDKVMSLKRSGFREKSMSRALSHTDVFVSTPVMDRYKMTKMHSHPSASNNLYNTLSMNQTATKRQAFASRRTHTVEQLQYIPGHHHHYRTASKTEVTV